MRVMAIMLLCLAFALAIGLYILYFSQLLHRTPGYSETGFFGYDFSFFDYAFHVVITHQHAVLLYHRSLEQPWMLAHGYPLIGHNQYLYPPQFALFWSWLGYLPYHVALTFWFSLSILLYAGSIFLLIRMTEFWRSKWKLVTAICIAFCCLSFLEDIVVSNSNTLIFALIVGTWYLHQQQRNILAGIPLGLAILFKVTPLSILVYLLIRRQWRTGLSTIGTVMAISIVTGFTLGWRVLGYYAINFIHFGDTSLKNGPAPYNNSFLGVLNLLRKGNEVHISVAAVHVAFLLWVIGVLALYAWVLLKKPRDARIEASLATLSMLLFSPLVEITHLIVILIPVFLLSHYVLSITWTSPLLRRLTWFALWIGGFTTLLEPLLLLIVSRYTHLGWSLYLLYFLELAVMAALTFSLALRRRSVENCGFPPFYNAEALDNS